MSLPPNLYPLSTAQGLAIPLAVSRFKGAVNFSALTTEVVVTLPDEINICEVFFNKDVWIYQGIWAGPVDGAYYLNRHFCKLGIVYDLSLPATFNVRPVNSGDTVKGYINVLEAWVQMQNTGNYEVS